MTQALAGGFAVHEQSAYGQGSSFAGIAAGGSLQAMYWNPAVMTQFGGMQSASSYTAFFPNVVNTPTAGTYLGLGGTSNTYDNALIPAGYFSYQLNPSLWLGMSLNSPFGLSTGFPELWAGRDYAAGSTWLRTYNATPSIAYRINDWISVGLGVQIQYAKASLQHGVSIFNPLAGGLVPVGDASLRGGGWSYGLTAGMTLTPTPTTTVGIGYRSGLNQKLSGNLTTPLGVSTAETTIDLPDTVSLGVRQRIDPQWTLLGTVEWTNWSRIGTANVISNGVVATTLPFQYRDGWFFSGGVEYQASDRLTLRTGVAYEISPIDDRVRTPLIPDNNRIWASIGASYVIFKGLKADLAYSHVFVDDSSVNISATSGNPWFATAGATYVGNATSHADILSIGLNWQWDYIFK
ncbi:MAG TPA: outer membrane protein transport protein [Pseudolabrys sp.]|nr:outer membrane protein transport protein [Pseudolabrys sp.]